MREDLDRAGHKLSYDELKAAEAAFQGRPFNEAWSRAAGAGRLARRRNSRNNNKGGKP